MNTDPFFDVEGDESDFFLPRRKWRELVFTGAMKLIEAAGAEEASGECFVRDPSRPMPTFDNPKLFPPNVRFRVRRAESKKGEWMRIERMDEGEV